MNYNTRSLRTFVVGLSLAVCGSAALASAASLQGSFRFLAADSGSLTGTVLNADGSPAAACPIKFFAPIDNTGGAGGKGKAAGFSLASFNPVPNFLQGKGTVAAKAVTDDKGKFEIKVMKVGHYRFIAGTIKTGMAGGAVDIEVGKAATLDAKLNPPQGR